jgi:hypothetical protein
MWIKFVIAYVVFSLIYLIGMGNTPFTNIEFRVFFFLSFNILVLMALLHARNYNALVVNSSFLKAFLVSFKDLAAKITALKTEITKNTNIVKKTNHDD